MAAQYQPPKKNLAAEDASTPLRSKTNLYT
jgi:hypothetical protein